MYLVPEERQCDRNMEQLSRGLRGFVVVDGYFYQFVIGCRSADPHAGEQMGQCRGFT
jgi:hypothetical protein